MGHLVRQWIPFFIAIITALLVLLGYLLPSDVLTFTYRGQQIPLQHILVEWAVIVSSFAFLLGLWNVLRVHLKKAFRGKQIWSKTGSLLLVFAALTTLGLSLLSLFPNEAVAETANGAVQEIFDYVISPVGASLAALVVFALALAAARLLRTRRSATAILFASVAAIVLLTSVPLAGLEPGLFSGIRHWVINVFGMAGMRGLLLGVVLGTAITALRFFWPRGES
jgi:hypothetical protein